MLVSSHLLSEMEETVDDVVIVSQGKLVLQTTLAELANRTGTTTGMRVRAPDLGHFTNMLTASNIPFRSVAPDTIVIDGATPEWLGPILAQHQIVVYEVIHEKGSLEDVFLELTHGFDATVPGGAAPGTGPMGGTPDAAGVPDPTTPTPGGPS